MSLGIKAKFIVGFDGKEHRLLRDGVVVVEENRIKHVGKSYPGSVDRWINAGQSLVIPGLINTHIHASSSPKDKSFLEDIGVRQFYMSNLGENLTALGRSIKPEDHEIFARYSIAECLLSGNTTILEIGMIDSLGAQKAVDIVGEMGIRAYLGPSIYDGVWERSQAANIQTRWLDPEAGLKKLEDAESFALKHKGSFKGRIMAALYPTVVDSCSAQLQRAIKRKGDELDIPISIHAAEWIVEFQNMLRMYGRTPVEFLHDTGLLCPRLIIGHGWAISGHPLVAYPPVDGGDLRLLAASGATVSHDPVVFAKRGNKMHSHSTYLKAGVNVSIGTDTAPQDMLNEMRIASYASKFADWDCYSGSSREIFYSATLGGARGLGRNDLGMIAKGAIADLVVIDMSSINNVPVRDPIRNLVNCTQRSDVKMTIVNGAIVVEEGKLLTADAKKLVSDVQKSAEAIWSRLPDNHYLKWNADQISPISLKMWEE